MYSYSAFDMEVHSDIQLAPLFQQTVSKERAIVTVEKISKNFYRLLKGQKWSREETVINPDTGHIIILMKFRSGEVYCEYSTPTVIFLIDIEKLHVSYFTDELELVPIYLSSKIFPFIMNARGYHLFHASCVATDNKAFAFFAPHAGGKSTVATALVKTCNEAQLISDDVLPIIMQGNRAMVMQSSTYTRLWNPVGQDTQFYSSPSLGRHIPKKIINFSQKTNHFWPLQGIYFIKRIDNNVSFNIMPISPQNISQLLLYQYYETGYSYYANDSDKNTTSFIERISIKTPAHLAIVDKPLLQMEDWARKFWHILLDTDAASI